MYLRPFLLALLVLGCGARAYASTCGTPPQDPAALGIDLSQQAICDPLVPEKCLLPFPSDYLTVADPLADTGRRVHFDPAALPTNNVGTPLEAVELNHADGFSPGVALLVWMPTADLVLSGAPALTDIGHSLDADSPVVLVDTRNGKRVPAWAELDANAPAGNQALIIRPAVDFQEGHHYIAAIRGIVDGTGTSIPPSAASARPTRRSRRAATTWRSFSRRSPAPASAAAASCSSRGTSRSRAPTRSPGGCCTSVTTRSGRSATACRRSR
jgi:hypothetical protein